MASCLTNIPWKLYSSRAISAWGDRMWLFAVGLFMIELSPDSLKWPAILGLSQSLAIALFGPIIGRWIDATPRLKAAKYSLIIQNLAVVICGVGASITFFYRLPLESQAEGWGLTAACAGMVASATIARLGSLAMTVAVYKDWVAIMANGDQNKLASMNSTCRSIDLTTYIVAPIFVGQIMYFISHTAAAISIAAWNVLTFFIEYFLLWKIYQEVPLLAVKKKVFSDGAQAENEPLNQKDQTDDENTLKSGEKDQERGDSCFAGLRKRLIGFGQSWKIYFTHDIRNAGVGLACLYMTVLGFDAITTGYAYSQGVPEYVLGILAAIGAIMGLIGSITFPFLVRCVGLERTGLYGFGMETMCLTLCVASVWAPGSPFDASALISSTASLSDGFMKSNATGNNTDTLSQPNTPDSYTSVILLMTGIIAARFGLWIADLSVNQVLQQVEDHIRGTLNGVQSSLNMVFDTLRLFLVITLPLPKTFGYLVCMSFTAVFTGWGFFASYSYRKRGHILPFQRVLNNLPPDQVHRINNEEKAKASSDPQELVVMVNDENSISQSNQTVSKTCSASDS